MDMLSSHSILIDIFLFSDGLCDDVDVEFPIASAVEQASSLSSSASFNQEDSRTASSSSPLNQKLIDKFYTDHRSSSLIDLSTNISHNKYNFLNKISGYTRKDKSPITFATYGKFLHSNGIRGRYDFNKSKIYDPVLVDRRDFVSLGTLDNKIKNVDKKIEKDNGTPIAYKTEEKISDGKRTNPQTRSPHLDFQYSEIVIPQLRHHRTRRSIPNTSNEVS